MVSINSVILGGNLTRDPEVRYTPQGTAVARLGLAINQVYRTKDGEKKEDVCFVDVEVWARQAETCNEYLKKGRAVVVEGTLKLDTWTTNDGQKRSKLRVVGERMQLLGTRQAGGEGGPAGQSPPARTQPQAQEQQYEPTYSEAEPGPQYEDAGQPEPPAQDDIPF